MPLFPNFVRAAGAFLVVALASAPATAAESFDGCSGYVDAIPAVISTPGVWCLRKDVSTGIATGSALTIAANNVTLECNGFRVGGLAGGPDSGAVGIHSIASATTVRGCSVRGFAIGVRAEGFGVLVEDVRVEAANTVGVSLGNDGAVVRRVRLLDIGGRAGDAAAIAATDGGRADVSDNEIDGVSSTGGDVVGIRLAAAEAHIVSGNTLRGLVPSASGALVGILVEGPAIVAANRLESPASAGTAIRCDADDNLLRDNTVLGFAEAFGVGCVDADGNLHRALAE